jgi:glycosyltransferase involved in cell wall biosynthesis
MKFLIIADSFPPMRTSAAVHMYELALELTEKKHEVTVIIPSETVDTAISINNLDGFSLILVRSPKLKDIGYLRRVFAEFITPYLIFFRLRHSPIFEKDIDGIIWYSPSIFFGPLISKLKRIFQCKSYLILRDIFPDWAVDLGLMKKGIPYYFFKAIEFHQYKVADSIGIQAPGNFKYFEKKFLHRYKPKVELLWTWIRPTSKEKKSSIDLSKTHLNGKIIFVYAGNMGVAQDFELIFDLIDLYRNDKEVGFVFVGRGSEFSRLLIRVQNQSLLNVLFYDEIDSLEVPSLYSQCHVGLVTLDPRHKTQNIPGKFLSYMLAGLPVLARLNMNNDLIKIINQNNVGESYTGFDSKELKSISDVLLQNIKKNNFYPDNCKNLAKKMFSSEIAAKNIIKALERK